MTEFKVLTWLLYSPNLIPIYHLWDVLKTNLIHEDSTSQVKGLNLLLMSWCQVPQDTIRGLVISLP